MVCLAVFGRRIVFARLPQGDVLIYRINGAFGYFIFAVQPAAEVNKFAPGRTEGKKFLPVCSVVEVFFTGWASVLHWFRLFKFINLRLIWFLTNLRIFSVVCAFRGFGFGPGEIYSLSSSACPFSSLLAYSTLYLAHGCASSLAFGIGVPRPWQIP